MDRAVKNIIKTILLPALLSSPLYVKAQEQARLIIMDTGQIVISRNIYGQFSEHLGRGIYDGFYRNGEIRTDVVKALRRIKVPVLRWPSGCFADQYHWRDGVGPLSQRPKTVNTTWGMVTEDNSFGTSEFMELCKRVGCEPYIAGNVGTGTPQEMENWIEYLNFDGNSTQADLRHSNGHQEPYHVSFWGVGNESWGCGGNMTPETYADKYRQYATFCMDYPGSLLQRIASGANGADYHWTETLMKHIPLYLMQGLSLHYYTMVDGWNHKGSATQFSADAYFHSLKSALQMQTFIEKHSAIMDHYDPQKEVALVVDEWGIWTDPEPGTNPAFLYQQNSLRDALIAASTLNIFNNHADRVKMACLAQTVNVLQALILTKGDQMLLTPTYYVFDLYKVHQNAKLMPINIKTPYYKNGNDSIPAVNASASRDSAGAVHVSLANIDPDSNITVSATLNSIHAETVTGQILTSAKVTDINTFENPDYVTIRPFNEAILKGKELVVRLPPKSVVVLELK